MTKVKDNSIPLLIKPRRPKLLGGITVKVKTGCGNLYLQMNWFNGRLFEVFATLGHGGGCANSEMEALTRSITLGLKCGVPLDEYVHQFRGIRCPNPVPFPKEDAVWSCPDAIAKTLEQYGALSVDEVIELIRGVNGGAVMTTAPESNEDEEARAVATMRERAEVREKQGLNE